MDISKNNSLVLITPTQYIIKNNTENFTNMIRDDDSISSITSYCTCATSDEEDNNNIVVVKERKSTSSTSIDILNYSRRLLYISHFFAQFSETAWQFSLLLFLSAFVNYQSVLYVSTYGFISNAAVCLCSTYVGSTFIDSSINRLKSIQFLIITQNICVIIASIQCYLLLVVVFKESNHNNKDVISNNTNDNTASHHSTLLPTDNYYYSTSLLIGIHIFGPIANILDRGITVAIERDWVVVMGQVAATAATTTTTKLQQQQKEPQPRFKQKHDDNTNDDDDDNTSSNNNILSSSSSWLVETNVCMKQIDLFCKILSPAITGFFIDLLSDGNNNNNTNQHLPIAAIIVGLLNVSSLIVEYICTERIYYLIPELNKKLNKIDFTNNNMNKCKNNIQGEMIDLNNNMNEDDTNNNDKHNMSIFKRYIKLPSSLLLYMKQPVSYAGIGLSLLYLNTLTFGGVMISYLLYSGMKISTVGTWRGISSLIGLLGTFVYHISIQHNIDIISIGMYSIIYQFICITFSMISMLIHNDYSLSMSLMIIGVCTSRIGLYVFDMSITQLMQMNIPYEIRGIIGGIQESLNSFFQLLSYTICLLYYNPKDFIIPVLIGYIAVIIAVLLYGFGIYYHSSHFISKPHSK